MTTLKALFTAPPTAKEQATMNIRLDKDLRDAFNMLCLKNSISASEVIRKFMLQAVEEASKLAADFPDFQ